VKVNAKNYACFDYPPYLDRNGYKPTSEKPKGCPFDVGDVVVIPSTSSIGVVLGCICADGDLRTDADGMQCWLPRGRFHLRLATKADLRNKKLRRSPKLDKELKKYLGKSKRTHLPFKYRVNVCRIAYGNQDIEVVADNARKAKRLAEEEAANHVFTEHTSEYQAQSVTRIEQTQPFMGG
jgi:hypothetical protein